MAEDDDDESMVLDEMLSPPPPCPAASRADSFTYTSGMDLQEELKVQGDMLQRVSDQQQYILDEIMRMRATRGMPGACPSGNLPPPGAPFRAAMCA